MKMTLKGLSHEVKEFTGYVHERSWLAKYFLTGFALCFSVVGAFATPQAHSNGASITAREVKNAQCCIPSLGSSPDYQETFKDGMVQSRDTPYAKLRTIAFGSLDGKPAAVADLLWNTGGSGNWKTLILFRRAKGKVQGQGSCDVVQDIPSGSDVGRLEIKDNKLFIYVVDVESGRENPKPLIRNSSAFRACDYSEN